MLGAASLEAIICLRLRKRSRRKQTNVFSLADYHRLRGAREARYLRLAGWGREKESVPGRGQTYCLFSLPENFLTGFMTRQHSRDYEQQVG